PHFLSSQPESFVMHERSIRDVLNLYNPSNPLEKAWTIPAPWYFDPRIAQLERDSVFASNWQVAGRLDQVKDPGQFFTIDLNNEPLVVVRSDDGQLRAFCNVCRHHAAAVVPEEKGCAKQFRCPYHGWTYGNDGALKGMVEFEGVCNFNRADNGLVPVRLDVWENFLFVNLDGKAAPLLDFLGKVPLLRSPNLHPQLQLESLRGQLSRWRLPRAPRPQGPKQRRRIHQVHH